MLGWMQRTYNEKNRTKEEKILLDCHIILLFCDILCYNMSTIIYENEKCRQKEEEVML